MRLVIIFWLNNLPPYTFIKLLFYMAADKSEASTTIDIHQQLYAKQYKHARVINPFEQCHRHLTYICFHFELISNLNFFTRVHKSFFRSLVITVRDLYLWSDIYLQSKNRWNFNIWKYVLSQQALLCIPSIFFFN